ncbi:MAG: hypothetical protein EOO96_11880 [Pedobacter sp.]|nr:MAG: hypothetical protein EOO96_11880 [Pedobacter sp.]
MIYANKKVSSKPNLAAQTAKIIANVKELEAKNLIKLEIIVDALVSSGDGAFGIDVKLSCSKAALRSAHRKASDDQATSA